MISNNLWIYRKAHHQHVKDAIYPSHYRSPDHRVHQAMFVTWTLELRGLTFTGTTPFNNKPGLARQYASEQAQLICPSIVDCTEAAVTGTGAIKILPVEMSTAELPPQTPSMSRLVIR